MSYDDYTAQWKGVGPSPAWFPRDGEECLIYLDCEDGEGRTLRRFVKYRKQYNDFIETDGALEDPGIYPVSVVKFWARTSDFLIPDGKYNRN